jgi:hypothetical protein
MARWGWYVAGLVACALLASEVKAAPAPFARSHEKVSEFRMEEVPWKRVFTWIHEETGKPIIASVPGSFTYVSPKGARFTVQQGVAAIAEALRRDHGMILVEQERHFFLLWADE